MRNILIQKLKGVKRPVPNTWVQNILVGKVGGGGGREITCSENLRHKMSCSENPGVKCPYPETPEVKLPVPKNPGTKCPCPKSPG